MKSRILQHSSEEPVGVELLGAKLLLTLGQLVVLNEDLPGLFV